MNRTFLLLLFSYVLVLTGCAQQEETPAQPAQPGYDQTKKMVVDILKTDEGKKAIQEVMSDEKIKQQLVINQEVVKKTIEGTLHPKKEKRFGKKRLKIQISPKVLPKACKKNMKNY